MTVNQVNNLVMIDVARMSSTQINLDLVRLYYHHLKHGYCTNSNQYCKEKFSCNTILYTCINCLAHATIAQQRRWFFGEDCTLRLYVISANSWSIHEASYTSILVEELPTLAIYHVTIAYHVTICHSKWLHAGTIASASNIYNPYLSHIQYLCFTTEGMPTT